MAGAPGASGEVVEDFEDYYVLSTLTLDPTIVSGSGWSRDGAGEADWEVACCGSEGTVPADAPFDGSEAALYLRRANNNTPGTSDENTEFTGFTPFTEGALSLQMNNSSTGGGSGPGNANTGTDAFNMELVGGGISAFRLEMGEIANNSPEFELFDIETGPTAILATGNVLDGYPDAWHRVYEITATFDGAGGYSVDVLDIGSRDDSGASARGSVLSYTGTLPAGIGPIDTLLLGVGQADGGSITYDATYIDNITSTSGGGTTAPTTPPDGVTDPGIEQAEDIYIHTITGTNDGDAGGFVLKGGKGFDGGDGVIIMKWDEGSSGFSGHVQSELVVRRFAGDQDGSFSVHQMVTPWSEATNFGTALPVAGVDYNPNPIASIGFNNNDGPAAPYEDVADVSVLVNFWISNPAQNHGVIFVPRGRLNGAYPGSFGNEVGLPSQERVSGLDVDDTRIVSFTNGIGPMIGVVEAIDDTVILEATPNTLSLKIRTDGNPVSHPFAGVEAGNLKIPLYRFGLGSIMVASPLSELDIDSAILEVHTVQAGDPATTFAVHQVLVNWDEATVTWGQFGGSGPQPGTHYKGASEGSVTLGGGAGSDTIDLTTLVDSWLKNPGENYGVILIPSLRNGTRELGLVMSERVTGLDSDDTRLIISAAPPLPTVSLTPVTIKHVMVLEFSTHSGFEYELESNAALPEGGFIPTGRVAQGTGGTMYFYIPNIPQGSTSYRIRANER